MRFDRAGHIEHSFEISLDAVQGEWLTIEVDLGSPTRYIRIETVAVDGWVILHEIRILGG